MNPSQDGDSSKASPVKPVFYDPDHYVIKLKYEKFEEFTELVVSHITRLLDLPGEQLDTLTGENETVLKDNINKVNVGGKKFWNPLKKKNVKCLKSVLSDKILSQIQQLTDFLGDNLEVEGLFRKPGNSIRQNQLITALGTGACINFNKSQFQAHDAASVLKTLLGQLSEPLLLPSKHFDAHIQISNMNKIDADTGKVTLDKGKRIETLQLLLLLLPTAYRKVLRGIFDLLYQTAKNQSTNKMSAANLSAMVTPHLLWPPSVKASDIHHSIAQLNNHVAFMIRHSQKIYLAPAYIRDAANMYYPESETSSVMSPHIHSTSLVASSSAVKRTASERLRFTEKTRATTENAINELFNQVNSMPNSSKKKKIVKNFAKHHEVLKYQNKGRKRNRTISGMLRKRSSHNTSSKEKNSDFYQRFSQPGEKVLPTSLQFSPNLAGKSSNEDNSDTRSLNRIVMQQVDKSLSHVSLPDHVTKAVKWM